MKNHFKSEIKSNQPIKGGGSTAIRSDLLGKKDSAIGNTQYAPNRLTQAGGVNLASSISRWGLSMPLAAIITISLGLTMTALIAVEFMPQDRFETVRANINPVVEDIQDPRSIQPPEPLKDIEVPPPPPKVSRNKADKVTLQPVETKQVKLDVDLGQLKISPVSRDIIDTNYQPLVRFPPVMPNNAQRSGHCKVRFDVSVQGQPFNVETVYCSDKVFARNTVKSVGKWKYRPRIENGRPITVSGVETKVSFHLTDARGDLIPE